VGLYWLPDLGWVAFLLVGLPATMLIAHWIDGRASRDWRFPVAVGVLGALAIILWA
jgi:hypothetical protein